MPVDKRLAYDGRGLQDVHINDKPAKVSESLYVVEEKARESVAVRNKVREEMRLKEKKLKEQVLRALVQKARLERTGFAMAIPPEKKDSRHSRESEECMQREKVRKERMRERERERRLASKDGGMGKRSKITRDRDCDINEKVALGMSSTKTEVMYDKRLFNQDKGMSSGFACDDQYNVYESGLITA